MLPVRHLGSEGLSVSALGLGLMSMSHGYGTADERDERESTATIHRAIELGCTFLDTAEVYGPFANEELLGRALRAVPGARERVVIATKFGYRIENGAGTGEMDSRPAHIRGAVEGSLRPSSERMPWTLSAPCAYKAPRQSQSSPVETNC